MPFLGTFEGFPQVGHLILPNFCVSLQHLKHKVCLHFKILPTPSANLSLNDFLHLGQSVSEFGEISLSLPFERIESLPGMVLKDAPRAVLKHQDVNYNINSRSTGREHVFNTKLIQITKVN